ncbi:UNVERIFIED_CONTAM: hypothetical protein FKN15_078328 [Acipenser sinensis]
MFGRVDPFLSTLDSLSLDNNEDCSNNELFSALETFGLNAEDLELLLLDERMIRIEMDPDYIPYLNDLLTNNEILSYVHDSLENRTEEGALITSCPVHCRFPPNHPQTTRNASTVLPPPAAAAAESAAKLTVVTANAASSPHSKRTN